ncbi:DUF3311 domain-containing protein [Sporosarcina aquimarina]|uniref:DUF3311 domain-containing protein n=1 Tax=Sporosarcina TaxID=1569 RepID=UPI0004703B71|nr:MULTISPECIES: DUF3311 domain-containing protein [Sporosarcina]MCM3756334.1 DUF3311 domain-containing protein [Sporosarcina aquimarina]
MKPYYLLAVLPFIAILGGAAFVNKVEPYVLGLPFFLFWIILWSVLCSIIMFTIYQLDPLNKGSEED